MVNLEKIVFLTHLFLDVLMKYLFPNLEFHKCTVYTTDDEDLPKGPPPSSEDLGKCGMENNIFLFFHNAIIPQNVMHVYAIYSLFSL